MKAVRVHEYGGPEVLRYEDVAPEPLGPRQLRIRHIAIGVNFIDTYERTGLYPAKLPFVPGREGAGVVVETGSKVANVHTGDRVAYAHHAAGSYAEERVIEAFADAILALDDSVPTGTYVDMCSKLPVVDPEKIASATIIMRGEFDGIASLDDLIEFFRRLPNPDKQFAVMAGISHASFQQINYLTVYHILHAFFSQPEPVYRG